MVCENLALEIIVSDNGKGFGVLNGGENKTATVMEMATEMDCATCGSA